MVETTRTFLMCGVVLSRFSIENWPCCAERIRPMPGARTLVGTLKHHGCRTVLVTGGFHHFADPVAEELGFERVVANRFAVESARLSGALGGAVMDSSGKERVLREELARLGENAASLATGDGANDIPMLQAATYGVAYYAKPKARAAANAAASGSMTERVSSSASSRLRSSPSSRRIQPRTSRSSRVHSCRGRTWVPWRGLTLSNPFATRIFTASRTTVRLMPSSSHSSGSAGKAAPEA